MLKLSKIAIIFHKFKHIEILLINLGMLDKLLVIESQILIIKFNQLKITFKTFNKKLNKFMINLETLIIQNF